MNPDDKEAKEAILDKLSALGRIETAIFYNGGCDSGEFEEIEPELPEDLTKEIEELCSKIIYDEHGDWYTGATATNGSFVFNVPNRAFYWTHGVESTRTEFDQQTL